MKDILNFIRETQSNKNLSPDIPRPIIKIKNQQTKKRETFQPNTETVQMLRWLLDYTTHLNSYPCPLSPELALFVVAKDDMYVPRNGVTNVQDLWPGMNRTCCHFQNNINVHGKKPLYTEY